MILPDYIEDKHIRNELLIRLLDDELIGEEAVPVEDHLAGCAVCRERFSELRQTSNSFDSFISSVHPAHSVWERQQLAQKLDSIGSRTRKVQPRWNTRRMGWGLTVAATLTLGVLLLPHWREVGHVTSARNGTFQTASSAFEVDGETFIALPYSNPDLPTGAPRIVQMQVPVSSLADVGIYIEPLGNGVAAPDRAVLADVLLGLDGQPLGVHVLPSD
jgi:anti-sigma factor RsiW